VSKIIESYETYNSIGEIIVWNNNKHLFISDLGLSKVKVLNCNADFGLDSRFVGSILAKNRCVIVHDDDLLLSEPNIQNLIRNFEIDHTRIYTYEGRIPQGGGYTCAPGPGRVEDVSEPTEVPIALTRSTCFDRLYASEYAKFSDVVFYDVYTNLNGEDIVFSYIVSHLSGKMPLVLPIPDKNGYIELPAALEGKISTRMNFIERRNDLIQRCEIILPFPKYPAPSGDKFVFFGAGNYPFAYYNDSFSINSKFKKLIAKESNGIKYLSLSILEKCLYAISSIRCDINMGSDDSFNLGAFYKGDPTPTEFSLIIDTNGRTLESKRVLFDLKGNYVSNLCFRLKDFFKEDIDSCVLKRIDIVCHNQGDSTKELCITEMSLVKESK